MEDNKLIAEFMGHKPKSILGHGSVYNDYSKSWDWLMPVVNKCMQTGDNTDEWDALGDALSTINRTNVYQAVVEFINNQNK